jgi:hypothetical protein
MLIFTNREVKQFIKFDVFDQNVYRNIPDEDILCNSDVLGL